MQEQRTVVAVIGNPASDNGHAGAVCTTVHAMLCEAGLAYGFAVRDLTGFDFDDSLRRAHGRIDDYDCLIVVGGDGMVSLGVNAIGRSGKPLGLVAIGSGNDFARSMRLPVNRVAVAVEGIVGAVVTGSHIDVDMGHVSASVSGDAAVLGDAAIPDGATVPGGTTGDGDGDGNGFAGSAVLPDVTERYYAGMLSCGMDATVNDRANQSRLPNGPLRYFAAVLAELPRLRSFGYHVRSVLQDGTVEQRDILSPLLTIANSRYVGGGILMSPHSRLDDGLLDMVWLDRMPSPLQCARAIAHAYDGRILEQPIFHWQRVRSVELSHADGRGAPPPVLMADGEPVGRFPAKVAVERRSLRVLVPPAVAAARQAAGAPHCDGTP